MRFPARPSFHCVALKNDHLRALQWQPWLMDKHLAQTVTHHVLLGSDGEEWASYHDTAPIERTLMIPVGHIRSLTPGRQTTSTLKFIGFHNTETLQKIKFVPTSDYAVGETKGIIKELSAYILQHLCSGDTVPRVGFAFDLPRSIKKRKVVALEEISILSVANGRGADPYNDSTRIPIAFTLDGHATQDTKALKNTSPEKAPVAQEKDQSSQIKSYRPSYMSVKTPHKNAPLGMPPRGARPVSRAAMDTLLEKYEKERRKRIRWQSATWFFSFLFLLSAGYVGLLLGGAERISEATNGFITLKPSIASNDGHASLAITDENAAEEIQRLEIAVKQLRRDTTLMAATLRNLEIDHQSLSADQPQDVRVYRDSLNRLTQRFELVLAERVSAARQEEKSRLESRIQALERRNTALLNNTGGDTQESNGFNDRLGILQQELARERHSINEAKRRMSLLFDKNYRISFGDGNADNFCQKAEACAFHLVDSRNSSRVYATFVSNRVATEQDKRILRDFHEFLTAANKENQCYRGFQNCPDV